MQINVPVIVKKLDLAGHDEAYAGQYLMVWVNPPRKVLLERDRIAEEYEATQRDLKEIAEEKISDEEKKEKSEALQARLEKISADFNAWFSMIWSKGSEDSQISVSEVEEFLKVSGESDPKLIEFVFGETIRMIMDYRNGQKN